MLINKITTGFVIQIFDTNRGDFVSQSFFTGDQCEYETEDGKNVDPTLLNLDGKEKYYSFQMVQPFTRYIQLYNTDGEEVGIIKTNADEATVDSLIESYASVKTDDKDIEGFIAYGAEKYPGFFYERFYLDDNKVLEI